MDSKIPYKGKPLLICWISESSKKIILIHKPISLVKLAIISSHNYTNVIFKTIK